MQFSLRSTAGPLEGVVIPLPAGSGDGVVTIGRDPANTISVLSPSVSRFHCRLEPSGVSWRVVDLQARNRTRVNGEPVSECLLAAGDRLGVGTAVFVLSAEAPPVVLAGDETILERGASGLFDLARAGPLPTNERTLAGLNALLRISHSIHGARALDALERQVLESLLEISPADHAAILLGENGLDPHSPAPRGLVRGEEGLRPIAASRTIVDRVIKQGIAIASNNVHEEDGEFPGVRSLVTAGVSSVVAAPLVVRGETIGVLYLGAVQPKAPFDEALLHLISAVANIVALAADHARYRELLEEENGALRNEISDGHDLVGESPRLREVTEAVTRVAASDATVLIQGESGTGKELVARAIHRASPRAARPFAAINCAALTETLLESELFGHEKGAFTGATVQKKGKFEAAEGGTVFLDEIGDMPPVLQAKLLRVLQERECERVGGTRTIKLDIRLVAATNRDLKEMAKTGAFRADLYYRINVVAIRTPALRERKPDIPLLAGHFAARYAGRVKRKVLGVSPQARRRLMQYDWPGNVRELENAIERAVVLGVGEWIQPGDLPESVLEGTTPDADASLTLYDRLRDAKRDIVADALKQTGGNFTQAGELLGVHANHLHRLVRTLGIDSKKLAS